ncbi:hypothetical protein SOVF_114390 isoform A, partial [Spinacia oleracea]
VKRLIFSHPSNSSTTDKSKAKRLSIVHQKIKSNSWILNLISRNSIRTSSLISQQVPGANQSTFLC